MNRRKVTDIRTKGNLRGGFHRVLYAIAAVLSLVGLADAIYLTVEHLVGETAGCIVSRGCSEVLGSKYASVGPVPLAAFGALAYFAAFSSAILAACEYRGFQTFLMLLVQAMFGVRCGFSWYKLLCFTLFATTASCQLQSHYCSLQQPFLLICMRRTSA